MYFQSILLISSLADRNNFIKTISENQLNLSNYQKHPDFFEVDSEEKSSIGIDIIKKLRNIIQLKPYSGKAKIILLNEAEKLTLQAQNSLLKILEEPPENTQIILHTSKNASFLPTILSRCNVIEITNKKGITDNILKAQTFLNLSLAQKFELVETLSKLTAVERKDKMKTFLKDIANYYSSKLKKETNPMRIKSIRKNMELIVQTHKYLTANTNFKLTLENFCIKISA